MSDNWDFYFANVNEMLASLFVDLGIRGSAPDPERPWLLWVWVYLNQPLENGLSSSEEAPILHQIEDCLAPAVEERAGALLVGRITTAGRREYYFYASRPDHFEETAARALESFPGYKFDSGTQEDPQWSQYLDLLYPTREDRQKIQNRHVVDSLKKQGDTLKTARPVSHWIYFKSEQDRSRFVAAAVNEGFKVIDNSESADPCERPYGVTLERVDYVNWNSVNEVTLGLFALATNVDGEYDGWETSVERDDS